uniref:Serum amyloid A protein n=1 Tax=Crocodylus porosus TaxID=8502 RepID=A0A7M4FGU1_CROPO
MSAIKHADLVLASSVIHGLANNFSASWKTVILISRECAGDMYRAYSDMREANWKDSDKYFHARGNYDAAKRGPGGAWAAEVISNARENWQGSVSGRGAEDTLADQEANEWGRSGGDPNRYRPRDLPEKY